MEAYGVKLLTVEIAYGDRPFEVTKSSDPMNIQLRSWEELWHKENMINIGIQHLSRMFTNWEYVAWIDADIEFVRKDWLQETVQQLQHHYMVQMWENAVDLSPTGSTIATHYSFMSQYRQGKPYYYNVTPTYREHLWHPGYAWAARRSAIDKVGMLIDTAILGAGDNHMAHALVGRIDGTLAHGLHPNYVKILKIWQDRAERFIRRDVGYVSGTIIHDWHGKKKDRRYHDRWQILVKRQYNPETDLKRDNQGLYQLHDNGDIRSIELRDDIRAYFRARMEDSTDIV